MAWETWPHRLTGENPVAIEFPTYMGADGLVKVGCPRLHPTYYPSLYTQPPPKLGSFSAEEYCA